MPEYYDKNGKQIKAGMYIKHRNGDTEYVYNCEDQEGNPDLGVNASNEDHISFNEATRQFFPLYQFALNEWEIISKEEADKAH